MQCNYIIQNVQPTFSSINTSLKLFQHKMNIITFMNVEGMAGLLNWTSLVLAKLD